MLKDAVLAETIQEFHAVVLWLPLVRRVHEVELHLTNQLCVDPLVLLDLLEH